MSSDTIALSVWNGRIAPVFDVSRQLLLLIIDDQGIISKREEKVAISDFAGKLERMKDFNVGTLICGAVSMPLAQMIRAHGIRLIPFIAGDIEEIIKAFIENRLPCPELAMPGCRCGKRRFRGRAWAKGSGRGQGRNRQW